MADGDDEEGWATDDPGELGDAVPFHDESLLVFAPTRILSVVGTALVLVVLGAAGFAATALVLRVDVAYLDVVIPTLSGLIVVSGLAHGVFGWRAYQTFAEKDVAWFMRVQVVGLWVVSTCFVVAGIVGGVWGLTLVGYGLASSLRFVFARRRGKREGAVERLFATLWPWFVGESLFCIVAPPVAAVISLRLPLPQTIVDRLVSDGIVLPIAAIVVLVLLVRRRPRTAVVDASP